jgi:hypothetical protein
LELVTLTAQTRENIGAYWLYEVVNVNAHIDKIRKIQVEFTKPPNRLQIAAYERVCIFTKASRQGARAKDTPGASVPVAPHARHARA